MHGTDIEEKAMTLAIAAARDNIAKGSGGPFGAAIVRDGEVIAVAANSVLEDHDPTAHAEVNAIRAAAEKLGTHDLSDCELYATGYPCPMCLSAIVWANIPKCRYALDVGRAAEIGFRDDAIYDMIRNGDWSTIDLQHRPHTDSEGLYAEYAAASCKIY